MKNLRKITITLACAGLVVAGLIGALSPLTNTTKTFAAVAPAPVAGSCTAVNVTNIQSQSIALGAGEKVTVDWNFTPPAGDCVKVEKFDVYIEVTRRSGRKATRNIDASATARTVSAEFTDTVDPIKSARAVVTASLFSAKGEKTQGGL